MLASENFLRKLAVWIVCRVLEMGGITNVSLDLFELASIEAISSEMEHPPSEELRSLQFFISHKSIWDIEL
jgi:hypothetical protein